MSQTFTLDQIARLPLPGDNVAIVTRRLPAGTQIDYHGRRFSLSHTLMEGHRFATDVIESGQPLFSWELPFGYATRRIEAGEYVSNQGMLDALSLRHLDFELPSAPNFREQIVAYQPDESTFVPVDQVSRYAHDRTFQGYKRGAERGVGTRNMIVLLGTSSRMAGFVRQLEAKLKRVSSAYSNIDGIVAVAHTEGDVPNPNNLEFTLRALAGFMVNPNVGAVIALDQGNEAVNNALVAEYLEKHNYPIADVPHAFVSVTGNWTTELERAESIVRGWLDTVNSTVRTPQSLAHLRIALQCGGSDAFSGISANPLLGWLSREVIRYGGSANLTETDELIGAESYVLSKVRNLAVAKQFLAAVESFKQRVSWHGASAFGNPSGGNKFRGLYNIVLKSIGAALKKHPDLRLDYVIDYAQRMSKPGFYFMDGPGNDLEGIAGQSAAGCNLILFTTGNGSITNFPFVPTIKVVTTSERFKLLENDMDIDAGVYLSDVAMDDLGTQALDYLVDVVSGKRSVGEKAGHAQVQLWRNWSQTGEQNPESVTVIQELEGIPLRIQSPDLRSPISDLHFPLTRTAHGTTTEQVGLILPTSLCAGQIGQMAARRLNQSKIGEKYGISRFVALAHTVGCGVSSSPERLYPRTMLGYLTHPMVGRTLFLEHGCETTHNDFMRDELKRHGLSMSDYGWASIQLDGGIDKVLGKIERWFEDEKQRPETGDRRPESGDQRQETGGIGDLRIGLTASGPVAPRAAEALAHLAQVIVAAGGTVLIPENSDLLMAEDFVAELAVGTPMNADKRRLNNTQKSAVSLEPTLAYAQPIQQSGFHIMQTPTQHWVETLVGVASCGVELIVAYVGNQPIPGHPLVPVVQISAEETVCAKFADDIDLLWTGDDGRWTVEALEMIVRVLSHEQTPATNRQGNIDFQVTRGLLSVSL